MSRIIGSKGSDTYQINDSRIVLSNLLVRGCASATVEEQFKKVIRDGYLDDAVLIAFMTRNIRGGKGERDLFYTMFLTLYEEMPELSVSLLELIPHYGSWRDIFELLDYEPKLKCSILSLVKKQIEFDETKMSELKQISLVAKWIPRERNKHGKYFAYNLSSKNLIQERYAESRKRISTLNKYLKTTEISMCNNSWDKIVPSAVPGRCLKTNRRAFLNLSLENSNLRKPEDTIRNKCRENFQNYFATSKKSFDTLYPHEIICEIEKCLSSSDQDERNMLTGVWDGFVRKVKQQGGLGRSIAMCDFSGSMSGLPIQVSRALGLLISEVTSDSFKNTMLTFDSTPILVKLPKYANIFQKVQWLNEHSQYGEGISTDFQKAMDLVLENLVKNRVPVGEEPENIIVLTDMAFDKACGSSEISNYTNNSYTYNVKTSNWQTHIEMIRENFKKIGETMWGIGKGYKVPRIVIWNLSSSCNDFHAKEDNEGVVMLSGWSPSMFKVIVEKGIVINSPIGALRYILDDPMYDLIRNHLKKILY